MLNSLKFHNIIHSPTLTLWMKLKIIIEISCVSLGRALFVRHARTDREFRNIQHDVRRNSLSLSRISRVITLSAVMQTYQWIVDSMIDQFTCEFSNKEKKESCNFTCLSSAPITAAVSTFPVNSLHLQQFNFLWLFFLFLLSLVMYCTEIVGIFIPLFCPLPQAFSYVAKWNLHNKIFQAKNISFMFKVLLAFCSRARLFVSNLFDQRI